MAFESKTLDELRDMRDKLQAAWERSLNATNYAMGSRQLGRAQPDQIFQQMQIVDAEIARRSDPTGGIGVVSIRGA